MAVCSEIHTKHINTLCGQNVELLGPVAQLRTATVGFVMTVRLSARMKQLGSHRTNFHEISELRIFLKSVEKIQVPLKSDKNNARFTCRPTHMYGQMSRGSAHSDRCCRHKL